MAPPFLRLIGRAPLSPRIGNVEHHAKVVWVDGPGLIINASEFTSQGKGPTILRIPTAARVSPSRVHRLNLET